MLSDFYKSEILRVFNLLGCEVGLLQNLTDADGWHRQGFLSDEEHKEYISLTWSIAREFLKVR